MIFEIGISSIPIENFKDQSVLVFDWTSIWDASENLHYPELVGEQLRLQLSFIFPLEHVTELIVLGKLTSSVAFNQIGVVGKII